MRIYHHSDRGGGRFLCSISKKQVTDAGGQFNGDAASGSFTVPDLTSSVAGTYTISGNDADIVITHHPFFITCNQIEKYVKSHLT